MLSVVIPVLNREKLLIRCLDSILTQTILPDEIIVVDNGSTDSTLRVARDWAKHYGEKIDSFKILSEPLRGACRARLRGQQEAISKYVIFFDSDDVMHPDLIENVRNAILYSNDADIICWKSRIHELNGNTRVPPFLPDSPLEGHLIHTLLRPQGYAVKKDFLISSGGWNKSLKVWNDLELGLRLLLKNPKIIAIDKVLSDIYAQKESITGTDFSHKEGEWEITLDEMQKEVGNSYSSFKEKILKVLDYRRIILAAHYFKEGNIKGAENLLQPVLKSKNKKDRLILKLAYLYTRKGGRGVWRLVRLAY